MVPKRGDGLFGDEIAVEVKAEKFDVEAVTTVETTMQTNATGR